MEIFVDLKLVTTDQNADQQSRISQDVQDMKKISEWFETHDPFPFNKDLINIATGEIAGEKINSYDGFNVGEKIINNFVGLPFESIHFLRSMRSFCTKSSAQQF